MAERHYHEQVQFTKDYVLGFLRDHFEKLDELRVLEVGCAEAGLLAVLADEGVEVVGLELSADRVALARKINPQLNVLHGDITDPLINKLFNDTFDLIILRDVIEHIPDRDRAFDEINKILSPGGSVYITFPPRFSPFAGHQQNGKTLIRYFPWLQCWPRFFVHTLCSLLNETDHIANMVVENGRIGLSIRQFLRIAEKHNFNPHHVDFFLSRPIYTQRFGWKQRSFPNLPFLSELFVTGCEVILITKNK
ncbi:class I SAM-dependent methyltransferase [bacterium]|nr:class I SAM-dependent methyltransferase [bacterium]